MSRSGTLKYQQLTKAQIEKAWDLVTVSWEAPRCDEEWRGHRALFDMMGPRMPLVLKDPTDELPNGFLPGGQVKARVREEHLIELVSATNPTVSSWADLDEPPPPPVEGPRLAGITAPELETAKCQEWTVGKRELWLELSKGHFLIFSSFASPKRSPTIACPFHSLPLATQKMIRDRLWDELGGNPPAPYPHGLDNMRMRIPD
jgi:hypothetical protein